MNILIAEPLAPAGIELFQSQPGGNVISVAEHTLAMMLAMARHIPQASTSTRSGKWEKKKFMGNELRGKTLGIVGLGSIGREVVKRARAFEMRIVAHDPYVTSTIAHDLGVELLDLPKLYAASDYLTLHVASTPETQGMLSREAFAQMKDGVRIVNCARGELVDEAALAEALRSGKVADASLDVFSVEPPPAGFPLFALDGVLATPHIGGSTEEAQEIVGVRIAEQVVEYLTHGLAINAVNMPAMSPEQFRALSPYANLADRLGNFAAHIASGHPHTVRLHYFGKIADSATSLLRNAGLAGVLSRSTSRKANLINALQIAEQRGWNVVETHDKRSVHTDSIRIDVETDGGVTTVEGAVVLDKAR